MPQCLGGRARQQHSCTLIDMSACVLLMYVCVCVRERERGSALSTNIQYITDIKKEKKHLSQMLFFITDFIRAASLIHTCYDWLFHSLARV